MLSGCSTCYWENPNTERQITFKDCLDRIPDGPTTPHYNDWAEVVAECDRVAKHQTRIWTCTNQ